MISLSSTELSRFGFVSAANRFDVLNKRRLASPCLPAENLLKRIGFGAASAAEVFNSAMPS